MYVFYCSTRLQRGYRALDFIKEGKVDVLFPTGWNSSREKIFHYSSEYINRADFVIYSLKEKPIDWNDMQSLKNMHIAVKNNYNYGDVFNEANYFKKINVNTIAQGFTMLLARRVDGFAGYEENWDYMIEKKYKRGVFKISIFWFF